MDSSLKLPQIFAPYFSRTSCVLALSLGPRGSSCKDCPKGYFPGLVIQMKATSTNLRATRSQCPKDFMQWSGARREWKTKQHVKNKCTKDISGIFFKWNISLLLATPARQSKCWQLAGLGKWEKREERKNREKRQKWLEKRYLSFSLRISAKQSRKQTGGGDDDGDWRKSRLRVQKSPPGNGFWSRESGKAAYRGGKGCEDDATCVQVPQ